jgi:HEAT repeat protein
MGSSNTPAMTSLLRTTALLALAFAPLLACSSPREAAVQTSESIGWLKPSPLLRQQLDDQASRLPWTRGLERVELIRWFAGVGEPAYERLLEMVADPREDVAAAAFAALGITGDKRLVTPILAAEWAADRENSDLGLERARTLVRLGCWDAMPNLIHGLGDERLYTRALCIDALKEATGQTFDFDPRGSESSREIGQDRWERWWLKYSGDPLR